MNKFTVTMDNKEQHCIDGESIEDIFMRIDGLRLQGKRWLKVYDYVGEDGNWDVYVNIDHIVSIEECY
jgi:hypothetical protein